MASISGSLVALGRELVVPDGIAVLARLAMQKPQLLQSFGERIFARHCALLADRRKAQSKRSMNPMQTSFMHN